MHVVCAHRAWGDQTPRHGTLTERRVWSEWPSSIVERTKPLRWEPRCLCLPGGFTP